MFILQNKKWFPILLWAIVTIAAIFIIRYFYGSWKESIEDGLISATVFAIIVWLGTLITRSYPTHVAAIIYSIIIGGFAGFSAWMASSFCLELYFKGNEEYQRFLSASSYTRLLLQNLTACWVISFGALVKKNEALKKKVVEIADAVTLRKEAELFKLRQQLQPHFLYNSLNSINALITMAPEKAQNMVGKLADFMRLSVKREAEKLIPLQDELDYLKTYLSIEAVRFGNRLNTTIEKKIPEQANLPPFLLQPVLENAIKFGLYGTTKEMNIEINIEQENNLLHITIKNPYDKDVQPPKGTGFGLQGIARRLYLIYGRNDLLDIKKEKNHFITTLKIPQ